MNLITGDVAVVTMMKYAMIYETDIDTILESEKLRSKIPRDILLSYLYYHLKISRNDDNIIGMAKYIRLISIINPVIPPQFVQIQHEIDLSVQILESYHLKVIK